MFGAPVWLWMHSSQHRDIPLLALPTVLLPIIKSQQYVFASRGDKPVFFMSWMWMNDEAERRYLAQPAIKVQDTDWACGERLWIRDWIAPFGDSADLSRLITKTIFPERCFRALYHSGAERGQKVVNFKGNQISHQQAIAWRAAHPLSYPVDEMPARMLP